MRKAGIVALLLLAFAGCGSSTSFTAEEEAQSPCDFLPKQAEACTQQKNREAKGKEVNAELEAIREGNRLKSEGAGR